MITSGSSGIGRELAKPAGGRHDAAMRWSARLLVAVTWVSGVIFAAYIVAFFGGVAVRGDSQRWNEALPGLYDVHSPLTTAAIGAHFMTGGLLLLLGPIQLIGRLASLVPGFIAGWDGSTSCRPG